MNKILVIVYVPLIEEQFDILIPINQKIGVVKQYIIKLINEINSFDIMNDNVKLYSKDTCIDYNGNIYVKDSGIKNGEKLILI